ncbi:MAG: hypothetical protein IPG50_32375 [Myxococcales bacterium]|nr:hypothetical protein [Myxococcales bacterium]
MRPGWAVVLMIAAPFGARVIASCDDDAGLTPTGADASDAQPVRDVQVSEASDAGGDAAASGDWVHLPGAPEDCEIDVPRTPAAWPEPIEWEPCGNALAGCRKMKTAWPVSTVPGLGHIVPLAEGGRSSAGTPLLMFARGSGRYIFRLVADPDTRVLAALRQDANPPAARCVPYPYNTASDRYSYTLVENLSDGKARGYAAIVGELADGGGPRIALRVLTSDPAGPADLAGSAGLIRLYGKLTLHDWLAPDTTPTFLGPTDEGAPGLVFPVGDAIFWSSSSLWAMKHKVWTRAGGSRDFLTFGADTTKGAANLGTDGKDMVWLEGSGRLGTSSPLFPVVTAKTAPFVTDPGQIVARSLRSDISPYGVAGSTFKVGCGYAAWAPGAYPLGDGGTATGIQVLRVADGYDAALLNLGGSWTWTQPLLVTCDELFALGNENGLANIVRIPLTSLGPWRAP